MENQKLYPAGLFVICMSLCLLSATVPSFAADGAQPTIQQLNTPLAPDQTGAPAGPSIAVPFDIQKGRNLFPGGGKEGFSEPLPSEKLPTEKTPAVVKPEEISDFERYLSERLDINARQLAILKLQPGIKFSYMPAIPLPPGHAMFYIPDELGGGFVTGTEEALSNGFKTADIKSPLYVSMEIRQFGYNLFEQPSSSFAPVEAIPVGPDYILGPGDEMSVAIWGKVNGEYRRIIDKDGKINLPTVGVLYIAGLTFQGAKGFIEKEYSRYYTDMKINISMGSLKSIRVFVVGNVHRPGSYTISSFSTIINALFAAGGPGKVGSMRDIQLKRNGQAVVSLDLYDFILKGDKTKDVRLLPEDVIFIPPVGPLVGVAGNVKVPAIYELKGETRLSDLIGMAGGTNSISFKNRIQIQRVEGGREQTLREMNLAEIEKGKGNDILLKDGDVLKIFPISQIVERVVHVTGAVKSPGTYGYRTGMTLKDLLIYSGELLRYANSEEAELTRISISIEGPKTERIIVKLKEALEGDSRYNIPLKEDDYLFVRTVPEWELYRTVSISGEVRYPGTYTIQKREILSSLIERAGGYTDKAYLKGVTFTRESVKELQQRQLDESINRLEQEIISQSARTIEAALTPEEAQQQQVVAEQRRSLIAKMRAARAKGNVSIKLDILERFKDSAYDVPLEDGDSLYLPEKPHQVQVIGSVYNPTAFVYNPVWAIGSYIRNAGGLTRNAEEDDIYILKMDGTAISKREWGSITNIAWDSGNHRWLRGGFMSSSLDPGDTIVIPEKIERVVWLREIKDLTQILYQIAVTAGVLIVAF